jgi:hypothetical protein
LLLQAGICGVEPADDSFEPEELGVGDERQRHVVLSGPRLDPGIALHDLDHVTAVHLQDLVDVDPWDLEGDEHLDHELVPRRRHQLGRRAKPGSQIVLAGRRDPVPLLRSLAVVVALYASRSSRWRVV